MCAAGTVADEDSGEGAPGTATTTVPISAGLDDVWAATTTITTTTDFMATDSLTTASAW